MMTLERLKDFARTAALRDRRSGRTLTVEEFEKALNAYYAIDALTNGRNARPVPPLFLHSALSVYRAVRRRYARAA